MRCCHRRHSGSREGIAARLVARSVPSLRVDAAMRPARSAQAADTLCLLDLTLQPQHLPSAAGPLVAALRPHWPPHLLTFKKFTDGITNTLIGCYLEGDTEDTILIRIYGQNTDLLIDREAEKANFKLLSGAGYAPKLYAIFCNGLAYEYVQGEVLTKANVSSPSVYPLVAKMLARIHSLKNPNCEETKPVLWERLDKYIGLIPVTFQRDELQDKFTTYFPGGVKMLFDEMISLKTSLAEEKSETVFCHNDLLLANVVLGDNKVTFIDYEYAGFNFQAFDIGNHFAEFAGVTEVDYNLYPDKECQMKWLEIYLMEFREAMGMSDPLKEEDVETLYKQVNKFALASHLIWAAWALVQAHHSSIDFDYLSYAHLRMKEYFNKKHSFLSL